MWFEHEDDSIGCEGQEEGPVEAEYNYRQEDGDDDLVNWLYGRHAP